MEIFKLSVKDYTKACRRGRREAELENAYGWKANEKVHKNKKRYTRKEKYPKNWMAYY